MTDPLSLRVLRYLPRNLVSRLFGWFARWRWPRWFVRRVLEFYAQRFALDLDVARRPLAEYASLVDLFTRELRPEARPLDPDPQVVLDPVDGRIGAFGRVEGGRLLQAKGLDYALSNLLGSAELAAPFVGGSYVTLYLSPRDYHRIHAPASGIIRRTVHEPGTLWPVNAAAVRRIPQLFAVNERVTTFLETDLGPMAVVMVGATNVGRIRLAYADLVSNRGSRNRSLVHEPPTAIARGDHLATFEMGSTVVLVLGNPRLELELPPEGTWLPFGCALTRRGRP